MNPFENIASNILGKYSAAPVCKCGAHTTEYDRGDGTKFAACYRCQERPEKCACETSRIEAVLIDGNLSYVLGLLDALLAGGEGDDGLAGALHRQYTDKDKWPCADSHPTTQYQGFSSMDCVCDWKVKREDCKCPCHVKLDE